MVHPTVHRGGSDFGDAETSNWVGISRVERSDPDQKMKGKMVFYDHWEPEIACFGGKSGALAARSSLRAAQVELLEGGGSGPDPLRHGPD